MTQSFSIIRGPQIPAILIFCRVVPSIAQDLSRQLHHAGLTNANDLFWALITGLSSYAKERGVCLATDFPKACESKFQMGHRNAGRITGNLLTIPKTPPYVNWGYAW